MERSIIIVDTSDIDTIDLGGMLYKLKQIDILDGRDYQMGNAGELLMNSEAYLRCETILRSFGALS